MKIKKVKDLEKFIKETAKQILNGTPKRFKIPRSIDYDIPVGDYGNIRFTYYEKCEEE